MERMFGTCFHLLINFLLVHLADSTPYCNSISPRYGGTNGGTLVTLTGNGFPPNKFIGGTGIVTGALRVLMLSETSSHTCVVSQMESNEETIVCGTEPMPDSTYSVILFVGTQRIPCSDYFYTSTGYTPFINSISAEKVSGNDSIITINGYFRTEKYGFLPESEKNWPSIENIYVGDQVCIPRQEDITKITNYALKCKVSHLRAGYHNISLYVSKDRYQGYGISKASPSSKKIGENGQIYMLETSAEIFSVSPKFGSIEGKTDLTIRGNGFGNSKYGVEVFVGSVKCALKNVSDDKLICQTGSARQTLSYIGNKGLLLQKHMLTTNSSSADKEIVKSLPEKILFYPNTSYHYQISGYLIVPFTGYYSFKPITSHYLLNISAMITLNKTQTSMFADFLYLKLGKEYTMQVNYYFKKAAYWYSAQEFDTRISMSFFNTSYTEKDCSCIKQDFQQYTFRADRKPEIQRINFTRIANTTVKYEVQLVEIKIETSLEISTFRLGLFGLYTEKLYFKSEQHIIEKAVNDLPVFHEHESVNVTELTFNNTYRILKITFLSERGNFPQIQVKSMFGLNITAQKQTDGKPSGKYIPIFYGREEENPPSLIDVTAPQYQIAEQVKKIFLPKCPMVFWDIADQHGVYFHQSFENENTETFDAFCGKGVGRNSNIYQQTNNDMISLRTELQLCFAYKGGMANVRIDLKDSSNEAWSEQTYIPFNVINEDNDKRWIYYCLDLKSELQKHSNFKITRDLYITSIVIGNGLVDEVYIGDETLIDPDDINSLYRRRDGIATIQSIKTEKISDDTLDIIINPKYPYFNFSLLQYNSNSVQSNWIIDIFRIHQASPPFSGSVKFVLGNFTSEDISATTPDARYVSFMIKNKLQTGAVDANFYGDRYSFTWDIKYLEQGGIQPLMDVDTSNLFGAENPVFMANKVYDGQWLVSHIPSDMIRGQFSIPQVVVRVNNVTSTCLHDCSFTWAANSTPIIFEWNLEKVSETNCTAVLTGENFQNTSSKNRLDINGINCVIRSWTNTLISCALPNCEVTGKQKLKLHVFVDGIGLASVKSPDPIFKDLSAMTSQYSFRPKKSGFGGGEILSVTGNFQAKNLSLVIGDRACTLTSSTAMMIQCEIPLQIENVTQSIYLHGNGNHTQIIGNLTYSESLTPRIEMINTENVAAGQNITIYGYRFTNYTQVMFNDTPSVLLSQTDTRLQFQVPDVLPGKYKLRILTEFGLALLKDNSLPEINISFEIKDISPNVLTLMGGTDITLTGTGFSSDTKVSISNKTCLIKNITAEKIICFFSTKQSIQVDNQGTDFSLGKGFAWNVSYITIETGDEVFWHWSYPIWMNLKAKIEETETATSQTYKTGGFTSGKATTRRGSFSHQFNTEGTYYYWSGMVSPMAFFHGTIKVDSRKDVYSFIDCWNKHKLIHAPGPAFLRNITPIVENVMPNKPFASSLIVITGNNFPEELSNVAIMFGEHECYVLSTNSTTLTCKFSYADVLPMNKVLPIKVSAKGIGDGILAMDINTSFIITPEITSISPQYGSFKGNTSLTIRGTGFVKDKEDTRLPAVHFAGKKSIGNCKIQFANFSLIYCLTEVDNNDTYNVQLHIGNTLVTCNTNCSFITDIQYTPEVLDISPRNVNGTLTTLTLSGTHFGDKMDNVYAFFGSSIQLCEPIFVNDTQIKCNISHMEIGDNALSLSIVPFGNYFGRKHITVERIQPTISPNEGSIFGGTEITISGNGFTRKETAVYFETKICKIKHITLGYVICVTPPLNEGLNQFNIQNHNSLNENVYFNATMNVTPLIYKVIPSNGTYGDTVDIYGKFNANSSRDIKVFIGDSICVVSKWDKAKISCAVPSYLSGKHHLYVDIGGVGFSNSTEFEMLFTVTDIIPTYGSLGGSQSITLKGSGFDNRTKVFICEKECKQIGLSNSSQITCLTPAFETERWCNVRIENRHEMNLLESNTILLNQNYSYNKSMTPEIFRITPSRGGTAGGTKITIFGRNFKKPEAITMVTIGSVNCNIVINNDTQIVCETGAAQHSLKTQITVAISDFGSSVQTENSSFEYIDVWSSPYTWGGLSPPTHGDIVVISENQTILLDNDTAVLKVLIIKGGTLLFDERDLKLEAEIILITGGGLLKIGDHSEPYQHNANIILHGHVKSKELPVYGTKCIAVREGSVLFYGKPTNVTWVPLGKNATQGSNLLYLSQHVDWQANDQVVIAATGEYNIQSQSEVHTITKVDGLVVTLDRDLSYDHMAIEETTAGFTYKLRAEVGKLNRNIKIQGSVNNGRIYESSINANGFETDGFGAHIRLVPAVSHPAPIQVYLMNVELKHVGQKYRQNRNPISSENLQMNCVVFIKKCSIHESFNKGMFLSNTHDINIEGNVLYNIKGNGIDIRSSGDTNIENNLAIDVKGSPIDSTGSGMYVTSTNLKALSGNNIADCIYGEYLYYNYENANTLIKNNVIHTIQNKGFYIYGYNHNAIFSKILSWNNNEGINGGDGIHFKEIITVNCHRNVFRYKLSDSLLSSSLSGYGDSGIIIDQSLTVTNTTFYGFKLSPALRISSCYNGPNNVYLSNLTFIEAGYKVLFENKPTTEIHDLDGSLLGTQNSSYYARNRLLSSRCDEKTLNESKTSFLKCDATHVRVMSSDDCSWDEYSYHFNGTLIDRSYLYLCTCSSFVSVNTSYVLKFSENLLYNKSYSITISQSKYSDYFVFIHYVSGKPDTFSVDGQNKNSSLMPLNPEVDSHGDWFFNETENTVTYLVQANSKPWQYWQEGIFTVSVLMKKCLYKDCVVLTPEPLKANNTNITFFWSDENAWISSGYTNIPSNSSTIVIKTGHHVFLDVTHLQLFNLTIFGELEFDSRKVNGSFREFAMEISYLQVYGLIRAGSADQPFPGSVHLYFSEQNEMSPNGKQHIVVNGKLEFHGKPVGRAWTNLSRNVKKGSSTIYVEDQLYILPGDRIFITSTSSGLNNSEIVIVKDISIDKKNLTLESELLFDHSVIETQKWTLSAKVGVLSRSIKIYGSRRSQQSIYISESGVFHGEAVLSNVEVYNIGQEGYKSSSKAHYAVTFDTLNGLSSSLINCSFHGLFSPAIGIFYSNNIILSGNVFYDIRFTGINVVYSAVTISHNLLAKIVRHWDHVQCVPHYCGGLEDVGTINALTSDETVVINNLVSGSESAAYRLWMPSCEQNHFLNNEVHSSASGVVSLINDDSNVETCAEISNFVIWRTIGTGIFYEHSKNVEIKNNLLIENGLAIDSRVIGPSLIYHIDSEMFIKISGNTFFGRLNANDCLSVRTSGTSHGVHMRTYSWNTETKNIGISLGSIRSKDYNTLTLPTIKGNILIKGNNFYNYNQNICDQKDTIFSTENNDCVRRHEVVIENSFVQNISSNGLVYFSSPSASYDVSKNCTKVHCDGVQTILLKDKDGTLFGTPQTIFPPQQFPCENVPLELLTTSSGSTSFLEEIAPHYGVLQKEGSCLYEKSWGNAFKCNSTNYRKLVIESMDEDANTRQLSPVAILGQGYLSLLKGPSDPFGREISSFMLTVATGMKYSLYTTFTPPQTMRYFLLNADPTEGIIIGIWYPQSNRRDVYVNGNFILPTNGRYEKGKYLLDWPTFKDQFVPSIHNETGANYFDRKTNTLYFLIKGDVQLQVKTSETIIVSFAFPPMTTDEFFGKNLVQNIAAFFDVPQEKVRLVNVIRPPAGKKRKQTDTENSNVQVQFEIGDEPISHIVVNTTEPPVLTTSPPITAINNTHSPLTKFTKSVTTAMKTSFIEQFSTSTPNIKLDIKKLNAKAVELKNMAMLGENISAILNTSFPIEGTIIHEALPQSGTKEWEISFTEEKSVRQSTEFIVAAKNISIIGSITPLHEAANFIKSPSLRIYNKNGDIIPNPGSYDYPWQVLVTLKDNNGNITDDMAGNTIANFTRGWANFTDITINNYGVYTLHFDVINPVNLTFKHTTKSANLTIRKREVKLNIDGWKHKIYNDETITANISLLDCVTGKVIENVHWKKGLKWNIIVNITGFGKQNEPLIERFDDYSFKRQHLIQNIRTFTPGGYIANIDAFSWDEKYRTSAYQLIMVNNEQLRNVENPVQHWIIMSFDANYTDIVQPNPIYFKAAFADYLINQYPNVSLELINVTEGSIRVQGLIRGRANDVNAIVKHAEETKAVSLKGFPSLIKSAGKPFMTTRVTTIESSTQIVVPENATTEEKKTPLTVIIVSVLSVVVAIILLLVFVCCCKMKKSKKGNKEMSANRTAQSGSYEGVLEEMKGKEGIFTQKTGKRRSAWQQSTM